MSGKNPLADQVTKIIDSVPKMDFHLGGLQIGVEGLSRVAHAIQKGDIEVVPDTSISEDAQYDSAQNTLSLKSANFNDVEFKSLIVHEAVHALIDLLKAKDTRRLAGEAAAYLAQALYLYHEVGEARFRHNVRQRSNSAKAKEKQLGRIYQACLNLIDRYKLTSRNVWLPPQLYQSLLEAIKGHDAYKNVSWNEKAAADGVGARGAQAAAHVQEGGLLIPNARAQGPLGVLDAENPFGGGSSRNPGPTGIT